MFKETIILFIRGHLTNITKYIIKMFYNGYAISTVSPSKKNNTITGRNRSLNMSSLAQNLKYSIE